MEDQGEVSIKANFDFFNLRGDISENHPVVETIRDAVRTGKKGILRRLEAQGVIERHHAAHNLIAIVGRNVLARLLAGDATYSGQVNYGALGSSSTTPAFSDTQPGTEVYRKIFA